MVFISGEIRKNGHNILNNRFNAAKWTRDHPKTYRARVQGQCDIQVISSRDHIYTEFCLILSCPAGDPSGASREFLPVTFPEYRLPFAHKFRAP
jgi:hypothetical protein